MTTAYTTTTTTDRRLPPGVLVGGAFALTTLLSIAFHVGEIVFTDHDPNAPEGPIESIKSVALVGGVALVLALAIASPCRATPSAPRSARSCSGPSPSSRCRSSGRVHRPCWARAPPGSAAWPAGATPRRRGPRLRHRRHRHRRPRASSRRCSAGPSEPCSAEEGRDSAQDHPHDRRHPRRLCRRKS